MKKVDPAVSRWESISEYPMMALSLVFLMILVLPLAHPLTAREKTVFHIIDIAIWIIFAFDYLGKFIIAKYKRQYINTHIFELMIVVVPALRPLRLVRLIPVIAYFLKYTRRTLSGRLLQYASIATVLVCTSAAVVMLDIEKNVKGSNIKTLGDAIWWTISTVTTVGYGDRYPTTGLGRVLAVLVMFTGISLIGVVTASIASWFVSSDESASDQIQMKQLMDELQEIKEILKKNGQI